jgi:hypothetical protein
MCSAEGRDSLRHRKVWAENYERKHFKVDRAGFHAGGRSIARIGKALPHRHHKLSSNGNLGCTGKMESRLAQGGRGERACMETIRQLTLSRQSSFIYPEPTGAKLPIYPFHPGGESKRPHAQRKEDCAFPIMQKAHFRYLCGGCLNLLKSNEVL